jgi:hypothetical protein
MRIGEHRSESFYGIAAVNSEFDDAQDGVPPDAIGGEVVQREAILREVGRLARRIPHLMRAIGSQFD